MESTDKSIDNSTVRARLADKAREFLLANDFSEIEGGMSANEHRHFIGKNIYSQIETEDEYNLFTERILEYAKSQVRDEISKEMMKVIQSRDIELAPYIVFIREYRKLINLDEEAYQKELKEIKKGANLQWEYDWKNRS